jgi:hypothetical protein
VNRLTTLFILTTTLLKAQISTGTWKEISLPSPNSKYSLIDFCDSVNGVLFTSSGQYLTTTNAGVSWSIPKQLLNSTKIVKVSYVDNILFVLDEADFKAPIPIKLHISTDRGEVWSVRNLPDSVKQRFGTSISILKANLVCFLGKNYDLIMSSDLGITWDTLSTLLPNFYNHLAMFAHDNIVISGGGGLPNTGFVKQSTDVGNTWNTLFNQTSLSQVISDYYTSSLGYFALGYGEDPVRYNSVFYNPETDMSVVESDSYSFGALFQNGEHLLIGFSSVLNKTNEDSTYYIGVSNGSSSKIKQFSMTSKENSWIVTDSGRVFQRIDLLTSVKYNGVARMHYPSEFHIGSFPNPFNGQCTIEIDNQLELKESAIEIYDVLGRFQKNLFRGELKSGKSSFTWNGKDDNHNIVSSGLYFVVVKSSIQQKSHGLIYIK